MNKKALLLLCVFLGYFGVHKFAEKKYGMGLLYLFTAGIFYVGWIRDIYLLATDQYDLTATEKIPDEVLAAINNNTLPVLNPGTIILKQEELCHFYSKAVMETISTVQSGYKVSGSSRDSAALQNLNRKVHNTSIRATHKNIKNKYPGTLYITNMRIVFANQHRGFEVPISSLTSVTPVKDSIELQTGSSAKSLRVGNPSVILRIIQMIQNNKN
jgi:restriction system protein